MASPGSPFITTLDGKRCTAVPKSGAKTTATTAQAKATEAAAAAATTTAAANNNAPAAQFTAAVDTATAVESSTSTTTSASLVIQSTSSTSLPPQQAQTSAAAAAASPQAAALVTTPDPAEVVPPPPPAPVASTTTIPTFSQIDTSTSSSQSAQPQQTQGLSSAAIIQTSQTDTVDTEASAATAQTAASPDPGTASPDVTASPALPDSGSGSGSGASALFTTIGTAQATTTGAQAADSTGGSTNPAVSAVPASNPVQSTVAVAGGVIGGVLAISMIAFFAWWYRRRAMKKRRSTLLTPLTVDAANGNFGGSGGEKGGGGYEINRGSIGPTPRSERFRAALGYNMRKIHGSVSRIVNRGSSPSVNMNRGNSQFIDAADVSSLRPGTSLGQGRRGSEANVTSRDRFMDWWTRLTADISFSWRLKKTQRPDSDSPFATATQKSATGASNTGGPDFLTLLGMSDRDLDREAQRRRLRKPNSQGSSIRSRSAGSGDHFLSGLNLNFSSDDPFSDSNAIAHISAQPAPLASAAGGGAGTANPFSDSNAIPSMPKPSSTYVADMRRSRGQSVSGRQASVGPYRESGASVESFGTRRNKFRSDPFDLERPELLLGTGSISSTGATIGSGGRVSRPPGAHVRTDSFTSKYSSGISMGDWSDPGPDVGPAGVGRGAWDGRERERESPTQGWRDRLEREREGEREGRRRSGGSQGSVGKAM